MYFLILSIYFIFSEIFLTFALTSRSCGKLTPKLSASVNASLPSPDHCLLIIPTSFPSGVSTYLRNGMGIYQCLLIRSSIYLFRKWIQLSVRAQTHFELDVPAAAAPGAEGTLDLKDGVFSGVPQGEPGVDDAPVLLNWPKEHSTLAVDLHWTTH